MNRPPVYILLLVVLGVVLGAAFGCDAVEFTGPRSAGTLRTAFAQEPFNFLVIGDWGRKGGDYQHDVARSMAREATRDRSRFVVSTGDNFYEDGVSSTTHGHWQRSYEQVYTAPSLQVPWYVVLGNHDHRGNVQAQIDYTQRSDRWTMPNAYFTVEHQIDDTTTALFVFIDTTPLTQAPTPQLDWLDRTLAEADATWRIVVGHHPIYAVGAEHGDNVSLIRHLRPILERHNVQAYFSGHVHSLQHLRPEGSVVYFVSGSGSRARGNHPNTATQSAVSVPGFLAVSMSGCRMEVQMVDNVGEMHHHTMVPCR